MRKRFLVPALLLAAAGALFVRQTRAQDDLDSLVVCHETQKLLFENAFVRVIDDVIPPGVSEPKHRHPHGIVIAIEDADTETHLFPEAKLARRHTTKGAASWNEAIVHDVTNVGNNATHFIRIDLR